MALHIPCNDGEAAGCRLHARWPPWAGQLCSSYGGVINGWQLEWSLRLGWNLGLKVGGHMAHWFGWGSGQGICYHVDNTGHVPDIPSTLSNEGELPLLSPCPGLRHMVQGR